MKEVWKDIKDYEGFYQVSNLGNVRSLDHIRKNGQNKYMQKGKILAKLYSGNYQFVRLSKFGNLKQHLVHKLVVETFNPNKTNFKFMDYEEKNKINLDKLEVNHKDENPKNNKLNNLEWCTHAYNINYGSGNKRRSKSELKTKQSKIYKEKNYNYKIRNNKKIIQKDLRGNFIKEWNSIAEARRTLRLAHISDALRGTRNKCGNCIWEYKKEE